MQSLPHLVRYNEPGHVHELTFGTFKGRHVLKTPSRGSIIVQCLGCTCEKQGFSLLAYVVMPNHVHLLVHPMEEAYDVGAFLKEFKTSSAKQIFRHEPHLKAEMQVVKSGEVQSRLWQAGGGYDRNMFGDKAIRASIDYIHANPVRKEYVRDPVEWPWSSAGAYFEERSNEFVKLYTGHFD